MAMVATARKGKVAIKSWNGIRSGAILGRERGKARSLARQDGVETHILAGDPEGSIEKEG